MDSKKRKAEENGAPPLTVEDVRGIIETFTREQLLDILQEAGASHEDVLEQVRKLADADPSKRKLFVRGLGYDTTSDALKSAFSQYGEISEAVAIMEGRTGRSKGYGFVTYVHIDGAIRALKEPAKKIDGRTITANLASVGPPTANTLHEQAARKIFVAGIPFGTDAEKLRAIFAQFGELEEGPIGLEKVKPNTKGFAHFVYRSAESAKRVLEEPVKSINGSYIFCKPASADKNKAEGLIMAPEDLPGAAGAASTAYQNALGMGQTLGSSVWPGFSSLSPSAVPQLGLGSSLNLSLPSSYNTHLAYDSYRSHPHHDISASSLGASSYGDYSSALSGPRSGYASSLGTSLYGGSAGSQTAVPGDPSHHSHLEDYSHSAGTRMQSLRSYYSP